MRGWVVPAGLLALVGCGRVGFGVLDNTTDGDGGNGSGGEGGGGGGGFATVQHGVNNVTGKVLTVTLPGAIAAGDFVAVSVACTMCDAAVTPIVTDNGGDTFAQAVTIENTQVLERSSLFFVANSAGGASTVTIDGSAMTTSPSLRAVVFELSGISTSATLRAMKSSASTNYPTLSSGTMPVTAGDLLVGVVTWDNCGGNTITAGSGFTLVVPPSCNNATALATEYKVVPASGSQAASFTDSTDDWYAAVGAAFH